MCITAALAGCNRGPSIEFGKVQGTVRINGKPQRGATVQFTPDAGKGNGLPIFAGGTSDDQGKYTLKYGHEGTIGEGAPVGWFRVTVIDSTIPVPPPGQEPRPSAVPLVYGLPSKTPLLQEVKAGDNTIDLDLKK
jgi:hypothetical protein